MRRPSRSGLSLVLALCANIPLTAQNLGTPGREKPFTLAGGFSFSQIFYVSSGIASRRDPFSYFASGNLSLSLYGWNIPVGFTVSGNKASFSQPFNQYAVHPTWKWITAHAGYTAMTFSPYTVNGHVFLGGGIDIDPEGNWKVSALCGRFLKAIEADTATGSIAVPSFERVGYALKATYGDGQDFIDVILFRAQDDANSIRAIADSLRIHPQQNLVVSVGAGKKIFSHFQLKAEFSGSAITRDTRAKKTKHSHPLARPQIFFEPRVSSAYYHALKTSFNYQHDGWIMGLSYERVDPGYHTLGAYYFNNDLENIVLNGSGAALRGKLNLAASTGIQRDNLDETKVSTMRRLVASFSMAYAPSRKFNLSASYSGFQTYTNIRSPFETANQRTPYERLDTLNFTQISRNASVSGIFNLRAPAGKNRNISLHLSWQDAADRQGQTAENSGTHFYSFNAGYSVTRVPRSTNVALAFHSTINDGPVMHTRMMGPVVSVNKAFFHRKLRTTLSSSFNITRSRGVNIHTNFNSRLNGVILLRGRHNVSLGIIMVKRANAPGSGRSTIGELTCTAGYGYRFGEKKSFE